MCQYPLFGDRTLRDPPPATVQLSCPHSPVSWRLLNQSAANLRTSTFAWNLGTRGQRDVVLHSAVSNYLSLCCSLTWFSAFPRMSQKRCPWELAMADPALGSVLQPQVFVSLWVFGLRAGASRYPRVNPPISPPSPCFIFPDSGPSNIAYYLFILFMV